MGHESEDKVREEKNKCVMLQEERKVQHICRKELAMLIYYTALVPYMSESSDSYCVLNLSKPAGHYMHHQFNIQQLYALPHCIYVFCIYLRTNSDLCHLRHKLIGFYNRDEKCLQRGTDWVFK